MTAGAVAMVNEGLRALGEVSITSFDEGTELAETCNILYATTVDSLLALHPWSFTLTKAQLARLADPPLSEWRFAFATPPDMIVLRNLFSSAAPQSPPLLGYEFSDGRVVCNQEALWADYQRRTDAATWPPYFRALARAALASDLAMAVTNSTQAAEFWRARAYGSPVEGGNGGLMRQARTADAMQAPPQPITDFPLYAAHFGS